MTTHQFTIGNTSIGLNVRKVQADSFLRAFRQEAQLSFHYFNRLWMQRCNYLNSPSNDILLDMLLAPEDIYCRKLKQY